LLYPHTYPHTHLLLLHVQIRGVVAEERDEEPQERRPHLRGAEAVRHALLLFFGFGVVLLVVLGGWVVGFVEWEWLVGCGLVGE
jgi:type VI protein secretion system component VasF